MNNKQYYSGERNHYFFGKLMTVRDFENEQRYFNDKRRLSNRMLHGAGIVSGLSVVLIDNSTFSLEMGLAIDYLGREIVVPQPSVKKVNVIKGFNENKDKRELYLCIKYAEELKESTFSVAGSSKSSSIQEEYNRVSEGYELFFTSEEPVNSQMSLRDLIETSTTIYDERGVKISLEIDKYVNPDGLLRVRVLFEKNNVNASVGYAFSIKGNLFKCAKTGEPELTVMYEEDEVTTYKRTSFEYYMHCDAISGSTSELIVLKSDFVVMFNKESTGIQDDISIDVAVTTDRIRDVVVDSYYRKHFDDMINISDNCEICLGKFHIIANQSTYFIEEFVQHPYKQYLLNSQLQSLLLEIDDYRKGSSAPTTDSMANTAKNLLKPVDNIDRIITGVQRINLGFSSKVGKIYKSHEFVHGLGHGNICIKTAIECVSNNIDKGDDVLISGDASIFAEDYKYESIPNVEVASMVRQNRGTLQVGVKLLEKTNRAHIDIRWWAYRPSEAYQDNNEIINSENIEVVISPNTIDCAPLSQVRFFGNIGGSVNQEIRWSVNGVSAGSIDSNGLYIAPAKEGVYEITAHSVKFPNKFSTAYVIVRNPD